MPLLVVLVRAGDVVETGLSRNRARGDPVLRVLVAEVVVPVRFHREQVRDVDVQVYLVALDRLVVFGQVEVACEEDWGLPGFRELERLDRGAVRLGRLARREDRPGELPLTRAQHQVEVALLGLRG
jgi:hypothetical protein